MWFVDKWGPGIHPEIIQIHPKFIMKSYGSHPEFIWKSKVEKSFGSHPKTVEVNQMSSRSHSEVSQIHNKVSQSLQEVISKSN